MISASGEELQVVGDIAGAAARFLAHVGHKEQAHIQDMNLIGEYVIPETPRKNHDVSEAMEPQMQGHTAHFLVRSRRGSAFAACPGQVRSRSLRRLRTFIEPADGVVRGAAFTSQRSVERDRECRVNAWAKPSVSRGVSVSVGLDQETLWRQQRKIRGGRMESPVQQGLGKVHGRHTIFPAPMPLQGHDELVACAPLGIGASKPAAWSFAMR